MAHTAALTRTDMQELSFRAAEGGDRWTSVYWSSRSYGDSDTAARFQANKAAPPRPAA